MASIASSSSSVGNICNGWSGKVDGCRFEVNEFRKGVTESSVVYASTLYFCVCMGTKVATIMDQFERQFEHLDVQTQTMEEAMSGVTTLTTPEVSQTPPLPVGRDLTTLFCYRTKSPASCKKHQMKLGK